MSVAAADSAPRMHDGFHFQAQLGLGYYNASIEQPADSGFSGVTFPMGLLFGGSLTKNIVLGGGLVLDYASSPSVEQGGATIEGADISQFIVGLGAYVDYYLDPAKGGLHFQGYAGWGGLETSSSGNVGGSDPTGLVTYIGGGYDVWISDQWSAGVMGRLLYAPLSINDVSVTTIEPAVVGTLTWH